MAPAPPVFNLPNVFRLRDKLNERLMTHCHETLQGESLTHFVTQLRRLLPEGIESDTLFESVRYLAGQELMPQELLKLCWRLAGNVEWLRAGGTVPPWTSQRDAEWVPLEILGARLDRDRYDKIGYSYTFRVLAGKSCPMRITAFWQRPLIKHVARHIGFSAPWGKLPFHSGEELVGLRLLGYVEPERSREQPGFYDLHFPASFVSRNRKDVLRQRLKITPCPNAWTHPCRRCAVGYMTCIGAVHRETYQQKFCNICGEITYFDPEQPSDRCIECHRKERLKRVR